MTRETGILECGRSRSPTDPLEVIAAHASGVSVNGNLLVTSRDRSRSNIAGHISETMEIQVFHFYYLEKVSRTVKIKQLPSTSASFFRLQVQAKRLSKITNNVVFKPGERTTANHGVNLTDYRSAQVERERIGLR